MTDSQQQKTWYHQVAAVLVKHVWVKAIGTTLFISLFFAAYFYVLKEPAFTAMVMPVTYLDRLIGFQPWALSVYVSLWVYVSLPPALLATRRELFGYGVAIGATCVVGLIIFYIWPTTVPPADIDWTQYPDVAFLKNIDAAGNANPSLHVATALFSGVWLHRLMRDFVAPSWLLSANWLWCLGIVYSTLATRQHVVVDVIAGLLLGALGAYLSVRYRMVQVKITGANVSLSASNHLS